MAVNTLVNAGEGELEPRTVRRVFWRLVPLLMVCYFANYLDRVNISFAALQMNQDLHLSATAYGFGASLFFITYFLFGVPSNLLLYRFGAPRWLALIMLAWGLCAAGMAFVHTETEFYAMRLLLGATEAGFYPGVLYFLTLWFPAKHRGRILGLFIAAIPISGIIGSPVSGMLLSLDGAAGLRGWRWLFLVEALPAIIMAPLVLGFLPRGPAASRWLPDVERDWLVGRLAEEQRGVEATQSLSVSQALTNRLVLMLAATYFTNVCLLNGITFFLPQIISGMGYSASETGFIAAVPSLFALVALIWWGRRSDAHQERYGHAAAANFLGGALLLAAMLIPIPLLRLLAIALAFACTLAFTAPFWAIPGTFLSRAAVAGGIAAISSMGVTGGFLAPLITGYFRDLTGNFRIGLGAIACLTLVVTFIFYIVGRGFRASPGAAAAVAGKP
jgi:MFS family permease